MSNSIDTTVETIIIFYKCRGSLSYRKIIVAVLLFYIYCSSLILQTLLKLWFFSATDTELSDSTDTTAVPIPQFYISTVLIVSHHLQKLNTFSSTGPTVVPVFHSTDTTTLHFSTELEESGESTCHWSNCCFPTVELSGLGAALSKMSGKNVSLVLHV